MLENATRICEAKFGSIYRWTAKLCVGGARTIRPLLTPRTRRRSPYRPYPQSHIGRWWPTKRVAYVSDLMAEEVYIAQLDPVVVSAVTLGGIQDASRCSDC